MFKVGQVVRLKAPYTEGTHVYEYGVITKVLLYGEPARDRYFLSGDEEYNDPRLFYQQEDLYPLTAEEKGDV
jgi:hypothetical protein